MVEGEVHFPSGIDHSSGRMKQILDRGENGQPRPVKNQLGIGMRNSETNFCISKHNTESSVLSSPSARSSHLRTDEGLCPNRVMLESTPGKGVRVCGMIRCTFGVCSFGGMGVESCRKVNEKAGDVGLMMENNKS